jgi:hypothetical protein
MSAQKEEMAAQERKRLSIVMVGISFRLNAISNKLEHKEI